MIAKTTSGIDVVVEFNYQPQYSNPFQRHYVFIYSITIKNNNPFAIQLMRRSWRIVDTGFTTRTVEGEGVVGLQPVLVCNQSHTYTSGCKLQSGIGKMSGFYEVVRLEDNKTFKVVIPEFTLMFPLLNN